jgi:hypothetical protein
VGDVDARPSGLAPVRHNSPSRRGERVPRPGAGDRRGTDLPAPRGFVGVRWGSDARTTNAIETAETQDFARWRGCRRRDSNPRHAAYDSAALWLYSVV